MTAMRYLRNVQAALAACRPWIYEGREGCLRLAREVGYCLRDSPPEERRKAWERSYNDICVIGYGLKPPINKAEWDRAVWTKMEGAQ